MLGQISEASKATIRETESGATAIRDEDPLLLLRAIILTHLSDPRLGADQNLLRVRMAYETVRMEPNDILKFYYQRFKALKTGYEDTMRSLEVMPEYNLAMTAHNDLLTSIKFMNGLNAGYKQYVEYYEHRLKDWPDTFEDAYLEMAKVTPKKPAGTGNPGQTNVYATKSAAGEKTTGTGGEKGRHNGNAGRGKGGRTGYGTRPGNCNKCKEPGHYSYECTSQESQAAASAASGGLKTPN
jgi:Zinc knuckle